MLCLCTILDMGASHALSCAVVRTLVWGLLAAVSTQHKLTLAHSQQSQQRLAT